MKKVIKISRIILMIIGFLIISLFCIIANLSLREIIFIEVVFLIIVYIISLISDKKAVKIINEGDKKNTLSSKVLYYILYPIKLSLICFIIYLIIVYGGDYLMPTPKDIGEGLGQAFLLLFLVAILSIGVIIPYIQSLIILLLRKIMKIKK